MSSPPAASESPSAEGSSQTATPPPDAKPSPPELKNDNEKSEPVKTLPPDHVLSAESISKDVLQNVQPSEVKILQTLRDTDHCAICVVEIRGITCVMKVFHGVPKNRLDFVEDYFMGELDAYRHLKKHGFCDKKVVPDFYGIITDMKLQDWPDWQIYHRDERDEQDRGLPGDAILMEYIPNMQHLTMQNYTPHRMETWNSIIKRFHASGLTHGDAFPRNMMFVEDENGNDERILWIDFERCDIGEIDRPGESTSEQRGRDGEARLMDCFVRDMAIDAAEHGGMVVETRFWWEW